jgi:hypothetical protein
VNDIDRWDDPEGPEPDEPGDTASGVPDPTPEQEERMERSLYAALAADDRRWAQRQALKRGLRWGLATACGVGALALVVRMVGPQPRMSVTPRARLVEEERHSVEAAAPEAVDAGVVRRRR